ncbi:O-antigen ligase family protein [Clostridium sp. DL1XJH146]
MGNDFSFNLFTHSKITLIKIKKNQWIEFLFMLILLFIPFRDILTIEIYGITIRISEVFMVFFDIIFVICLKEYYKKINKYIFMSIIMFFIINLIFSGYSIFLPEVVISIVIREIICLNFYIISLLIIYKYIINNKGKHSLYIKTIIYSNLFLILLFLIDYKFNFLGLNRPYEIMFGYNILRFKGSASEPAYFANLVFLPVTILINSCINKTKIIKFQKIILVVFILALFLTYSAAAYGAIFLIVFLSVFLSINNKRSRITYVSLVLIIAFFTYLISTKYFQNEILYNIISKITNRNADYSAIERNDWRISAFNMFKASPIYGNGVSSFFTNQKSYGMIRFNRISIDANCLYLYYLAERGLIGFLSLISLFISIIIYSFYELKMISDSYQKTIGISLFISVLIYFIHFWAIGYLWVYYLWVYIAIILSYFQNVGSLGVD